MTLPNTSIKSKTVLDILKEGRKIINGCDNWTQDTLARDKNGREVSHLSRNAVCWCSEGAIFKVANEHLKGQEVCDILNKKVRKETKGVYFGICSYNDTHKHEEVLKMWDKAIEQETKKESLSSFQ